jgi:DHA3 family macrolide efflux protein-like MFS transporter
MWDSILGGVKYIWGTQWLKWFIIIYIVICLMLGPVMFLMPLLIVRNFGDEPFLLAARETSVALGLIAGGFLAGWVMSKFSNKIRLTMFLFGIMGLVIFSVGFASVFWLFIGIVAVLGVTISLMNTAAVTVLQMYPDPNYIGRVFSFIAVVAGAAIPISMVIFGPIADVVSVEWLLIISGSGIAAISLLCVKLKIWKPFDKKEDINETI